MQVYVVFNMGMLNFHSFLADFLSLGIYKTDINRNNLNSKYHELFCYILVGWQTSSWEILHVKHRLLKLGVRYLKFVVHDLFLANKSTMTWKPFQRTEYSSAMMI